MRKKILTLPVSLHRFQGVPEADPPHGDPHRRAQARVQAVREGLRAEAQPDLPREDPPGKGEGVRILRKGLQSGKGLC